LEDDPEIINVVLLGSDTSTGGIGQTDVIILVNINMKAESVAMWHLPRDLLVYIPDYTIDRINRAFAVGRDWPGGPAELMKETILYNFGIEVDYYARVDFTDFQSIVEQLGGLTISVDCAIEDWRLVDPANTPSEAYNPDPEVWGPYWEQFTLNQGVHTLSPYMALWYARSRVTTNDFDRGRRQIDILRAMWQQARDQGIFSQIETIQAGLEVVDTDMELDDILRLIPLATSIDLSDVERYSLEQNVHVETWLTPDDGRSVQRPNWPAILRLAQQFVTPPTDNRLSREAKVIEVIDATWYGLGWDRVAADRMAWEGFVPSITETRDIARHEITLIYDYTGEEKGSELERLQEILRVGDSQIRIDADPNRTVDYRVVVGESYNACYYSTSADDIPEAPSEVSE
jgi:anionic cell wall polymer biosynthesis LytR-Cps2A-Psr (LCP) family protein